jgi:hypothetical protein
MPMTRKRKPKDVRATMSAFLRQLATTFKNHRAKLIVIVKLREELGPEWCTKVAASLDDIIDDYQRLRAALEAGNAAYAKQEPKATDRKALPTGGGQ